MARYVAESAELAELCRRAGDEGRIGLDVEFIRERTYTPKLALVQLNVGGELVLVDPLGEIDLQPLDELVLDPGVTKILHAATQDLEIFVERTGRLPKRIFDTQVAAAMIGMGTQISYGALVERGLGSTLKKGEAFTDWLERPLRPEQEAYAIDDVRYLLMLHDAMGARLDELGRREWLEEELMRFEQEAAYRTPETLLYTRVKRFGTLPPRGLAILRELAIWRERDARRRDRPRRRIVGDEVLVELARVAPTRVGELGRFRGLHPKEVERSGTAIIAAIQRGVNVPTARCPHVPRRGRPDPRTQTLVGFLDAVLKAVCRREQIDSSIVATSAETQALGLEFGGDDFDPADHRVLQGWRGELAGRHLLAFLRGELQISLDPASCEVRIS